VKTILILGVLAATVCSAAVTDAQKSAIDRVTGGKGTYTADEDVYKVTFPRTEVKVRVDGWSMHPFMGITSWAAFMSAGGERLMVMGDLALFPDEVNPVMSAVLDSGLSVTALHNHFFYDDPRVMFMHIDGSGAVETLAGAVRKALDQVRDVRRASPVPARSFGAPAIPDKSSITSGPIEQVLGVKGQSTGGMYKVVLGRKAAAHGHSIGKEMGVNTWAAFGGTDDNAVVDGDFAMVESEVQSVLKALRGAGINIVALHNHMAHEEPRYFFLHYWGRGRAVDLAKAVKAALETQRE
jgi:hypothetical protein